jgi:GT2 family glycosyltransferase
MKFSNHHFTSIIIVNYNTHYHLEKCLDSIKKNISGSNYEVIIIDNNSPDRTIEKIAKNYTKYNFFFLKQNNGFGAGCNYGAQKAKGKYLLFLNPDIELIDDSLNNLADFLDNNRNTGACSGLLVDSKGKVSYNFNSFPSYSWEFKEAFGIFINRAIKRLLSNSNITNDKPFEVDWFHGACLMIRKDLFEELGGFDENIFLYYEDVDLQKRIKEKGYKIFCIPKVKMFHATQSSVSSKEGQKVFHFHMHSGKLLYHKKHSGIIKQIFIRAIYIVAYIIKLPLIFLRRKFKGQRKNRFMYNILILKVYMTKLKFRKA